MVGAAPCWGSTLGPLWKGHRLQAGSLSTAASMVFPQELWAPFSREQPSFQQAQHEHPTPCRGEAATCWWAWRGRREGSVGCARWPVGGAVEKLTVLTHFSAFPIVATPRGLPSKSGALPLSTGLGSLVYRVHSSIVPTLTFVFSHPLPRSLEQS